MKHLFTTLFAIVLIGCTSTQTVTEPTEVLVNQNVDVYVPVTHPEMPKAVKAPNVRMKTITPYVHHKELVETIGKDDSIDKETKEMLLKYADVILAYRLEKVDYLYYGLDADNAEAFSLYFNGLKTFLKNNKELVNFYHTKPLYTKEAEAYSLEK